MAALTYTVTQSGTTSAANTKFRRAMDRCKEILDAYGIDLATWSVA